MLRSRSHVNHLDAREAADWYCACCGVEHHGGGYAAWLRRRDDAELAVVVCASCLSGTRNEGGDDGPAQ